MSVDDDALGDASISVDADDFATAAADASPSRQPPRAAGAGDGAAARDAAAASRVTAAASCVAVGRRVERRRGRG